MNEIANPVGYHMNNFTVILNKNKKDLKKTLTLL